jgi:hypothetical protein
MVEFIAWHGRSLSEHEVLFLTAAQWRQKSDEQAGQGFGPVILPATGSAPTFGGSTIQNLLEHTSGLDPASFANGGAAGPDGRPSLEEHLCT